MIEVPRDLTEVLPKGAESIARSWWSSLSDAEQREVAEMWDQRLEVKFFTPQHSDAGQVDSWDQVPTAKGGRFFPADDAWGLDEWGPGYFEHLVKHPELLIIWEPERRTFFIGCFQPPTS